MNIKKTNQLALLVLAAFLIICCSGSRENEPEKKELLISILRESGLDGDDFAPLIGEYAKLHPKLRINTETRSFEELLNRHPGPEEEAAGDILILDGRYLRDFINSQNLLSLEDYLRSDPVPERWALRSDSVPERWALQSDSPPERWALPLNASIDLLFYNIDLLKEAGFDRPPGTREDYLRYARSLRAGKGNSGVYAGALGLSPDDGRGIYRDVLPWIWASGIFLTREGALDFNGKALNGTLDFLALLEKEGLLAPGSFEKTGEQRIGEFTQGKIAMLTGSVRDIPGVREKMGDRFGVTRIPEPEDYPGKPVFGLSVWYGAISRESAGREAAWDFLLFLREKGSMLTEQLKTLPGHSETAPVRPEDPLYSKIWDIYEGADLVRELLDFPGEAVLEEALRRELELMFRENRAAAETALAVQGRWDQRAGY